MASQHSQNLGPGPSICTCILSLFYSSSRIPVFICRIPRARGSRLGDSDATFLGCRAGFSEDSSRLGLEVSKENDQDGAVAVRGREVLASDFAGLHVLRES